MQQLIEPAFFGDMIDFLDAKDLLTMPRRVELYLAKRVSHHVELSQAATTPGAMLFHQELGDYYFAGLINFGRIYWAIKEL